MSEASGRMVRLRSPQVELPYKGFVPDFSKIS